MNEYASVLKDFLPKESTVLELQWPKKRAAVILADINGDHMEELIVAYRYQGQNFILVLKKHNNQWEQLTNIKGNGYGISDLMVVPITNEGKNTLIVGWQISSGWSELNLLLCINDGLVRLPSLKKVYSKLEVEDMPGKYGQDGVYELAIWTHDTADAYRVGVYRISTVGLIPAKDVYPYYFKKMTDYYLELLKKNNHSFYWYYLSDAQQKTGDLDQALLSIDKALSFPLPTKSKVKLVEKRHQILRRLGMVNSNAPVVIDRKFGDVTGDGVIDTIYLTGTKKVGSPFWQNITLIIQYGKLNQLEKIPLKENAGYHPTLFLGDFTGDQVDDLLVVIDTGGSGGTIYAYVFSFIEGKMRQVFDADVFNEQTKYEVNYQDQYKVNVVSLNPKKRYILDLLYKGKEYLSEIYNSDGTLKEPIEGWVDPIGGIYPIDFERDGTYELTTFQKIAGRYHADGLGDVQNVLRWNGNEFVTDRQTVSIFGEDLPSQ